MTLNASLFSFALHFLLCFAFIKLMLGDKSFKFDLVDVVFVVGDANALVGVLGG